MFVQIVRPAQKDVDCLSFVIWFDVWQKACPGIEVKVHIKFCRTLSCKLDVNLIPWSHSFDILITILLHFLVLKDVRFVGWLVFQQQYFFCHMIKCWVARIIILKLESAVAELMFEIAAGFVFNACRTWWPFIHRCSSNSNAHIFRPLMWFSLTIIIAHYNTTV